MGFRPFVYRLAVATGVAGSVRNSAAGVLVEAEGGEPEVADFLHRLASESPPLASIDSVAVAEEAPTGEKGFRIDASSPGAVETEVSPDWNVCPECLRELFDAGDRRFLYPFITCTNCGPRYSIITGLPYDRPRTTMAPFRLCPQCRAEYDDPADRRFHAQPLACAACGPLLSLVLPLGAPVPGEPVAAAAALLREGKIVAVKGMGGFHLAVDPCNEEAVKELRRRKKRGDKPFALVARDLRAVSSFAVVDDVAARFLLSPERPIVLLRKMGGEAIAASVAPGSASYGVMLPATPLQHLLLHQGFDALVMTSGNLSDEPLAAANDEAMERLGTIADAFLLHDRGIRTRLDDSVIRLTSTGTPIFLRRSRGYVPRATVVPEVGRRVLAAGAELKATVCLTRGDRAFMSQHLGDLKSELALDFLEETSEHLTRLLEISPEVVACDLHPDYLSARWAERTGLPLVRVQHHHAHLASCMAENRLEGDVIGVIFDGAGYGPDGTVWGGEFLAGGFAGYRRMARLRPVPMPGGDAATREPYRMALVYLYDSFGDDLHDLPLRVIAETPPRERELLLTMARRGVNSAMTSSCGRLFDAVASIAGGRRRVTFEGQAAMELEGLAEREAGGAPYPFRVTGGDLTEVDFRLAVVKIVRDALSGVSPSVIARRFHATVAAAVAAACRDIRERTGLGRVTLSGGVFQNRLLLEETTALLAAERFEVYCHRLFPPNDGGISLGQAVVAGRSEPCAWEFP